VLIRSSGDSNVFANVAAIAIAKIIPSTAKGTAKAAFMIFSSSRVIVIFNLPLL